MGKKILGVDIGYDCLKLALCKDGQIKKTAVESMPMNLIKDGHITSPETLTEVLRAAMKKNGIRASRAALVLPNEASYVRSITMPPMNAEQLAFNLPYEFNDYITDELKSYTFDYAMISDVRKDPTAPMELMAVAIHTSVLDEGREYLSRAGLKLVKAAPMEYAYISLIRSAQRASGQEREYCILDLGYRAVRMFMYKGEQHIVTRVLEIGLSSLDGIIADALNVDPHLAHTYLLSNYEDCQNQEFCVNAYNNIAVELMRALNFYRFSNRESELNDVWIGGGGAALPRLCEAIRDTLGMELHPVGELLPAGNETVPSAGDFAVATAITMD